MPVGWVIAPDNADTVALTTMYPWSTHVLVVGSGVGYRTTNYPPAGIAFGDYQSKFVQSGNEYRCLWCSYQILIMRIAGFYNFII